jgi:spore maturation protein CgeB
MQSVVLFLHPSSKFGVLGQMCQDLKSAFERKGVRAVIREFGTGDPSILIEQVRQDNPDCTWSFNTIVDERWFYYPLGIPHVDLSVDSVTYSSPATFTQPSVVSLFVDKVSCDLFSTYSDNPVYWFPHGISLDTIDRVRSSKEVQLQDRPLEAVLIGSFIDYRGEKRAWDVLFDSSDVSAFVSMAEKALEDPSFLLLEKSLDYMQHTPSVKQLLEARELAPFLLANSIERYARGLDRERILLALKGRDVHIFTGKEDAAVWATEESAKNCIFHDPVPFNEVMNVCAMSKVVINSIPHIRKGFHERIFLSLASGAVTLFSRGPAFPSWVGKEARVVDYTSDSLQDLPVRLHDAESRPYEREKILQWLIADHSWDARLKQHLPEIEKSIADLRTAWENNPFWHALE